VITLGFKYALRERQRFALTSGGVTCAVILTVFLVGVYRGAVRGSLSYLEQTDAAVWVGRQGTWNLMRCSGLLPGAAVRIATARPEVTRAEAILVALLPAEVNGQRRTLLAIGLDPDSQLAVPRLLSAGRGKPDSGEVVVDLAFARRAGLKVGDELRLAGSPLHIVGISRQTNLLVTQYAFLSTPDLRRLLGLDDQVSFLLLQTNADGQALAARLRREVPGIAAFGRDDFLANNRQEIAAGFLPVLWTMALLGLAAGGAVVALTIHAAVLEKRADYALLAALGSGEGTRTLVVMQQAVAAAVAGSIVGLMVLALCERILPHLVPEVEFQLEICLMAAALVGAIVMASVGALLPARLASRIPPMEAFKR
jgi:ABC-type antimicrobial peptide transport system permease subunit